MIKDIISGKKVYDDDEDLSLEENDDDEKPLTNFDKQNTILLVKNTLNTLSQKNPDINKIIIEALGDNFNKDLPSQAGLQVAAICVTMAIAGLSGVVTGFIVNVMDCQKNEIYFVDSELFIEDENVPLPEWKYPRQNDSNLSSSGNKLDEQEREVHVEQEV